MGSGERGEIEGVTAGLGPGSDAGAGVDAPGRVSVDEWTGAEAGVEAGRRPGSSASTAKGIGEELDPGGLGGAVMVGSGGELEW